MADRRRQRDRRDGGTSSLYGGTAGEFAMQQDPLTAITSMLRMGGALGTAGSAYDTYLNDKYAQDIYNDYMAALATSGGKNSGYGEQLTIQDYLAGRYGATFGGTTGRRGNRTTTPFSMGTLGANAAGGFQAFQAEQEPQTRYDTWLRQKGMLGPITKTGTNLNHQMLLQTQGYANNRGNFEVARLNNPQQLWGDYLGGKTTAPTTAPVAPSFPVPGATDEERRRRRAGARRR
jgi:hypothetical protein